MWAPGSWSTGAAHEEEIMSLDLIITCILCHLLVCSGATASSAQGLILALCLGFRSGMFRGIIWDAGEQIQVCSMQGKQPPHYIIAQAAIPAPLRHFSIPCDFSFKSPDFFCQLLNTLCMNFFFRKELPILLCIRVFLLTH